MFKINIINSGYIMVDGGAMFGAIPKRAWARKCQPDENNLLPLVMRCVLAISEDKRILIDTGMGDKHLNKTTYYQPHSLLNIEEALFNLGYPSNEITDVVLTHLHFDHCGYATRKDKQGNLIPSFPNAQYWLSQKQWDNFQNPNLLEIDSLFADNIIPIADSGQLQLVDKDKQLCDGFSLRLFDGHTIGQLVPYICTISDEIYTFPGDLIPTSSHVSLEWISAYDISAITSLNEKQRFLSEAEKNNYMLIYCHDPDHVMSKVKKLNNGFKASLP